MFNVETSPPLVPENPINEKNSAGKVAPKHPCEYYITINILSWLVHFIILLGKTKSPPMNHKTVSDKSTLTSPQIATKRRGA